MILGCCGAGKSTLSKKLSRLTNLELIHLDQHYWHPNWIETPTVEWTKIVNQLAAKPKWIIDGNYGGTVDSRLARADTIIYLDFSTIKCLWRITKRIWKYHGQKRPDMPEGCNERFDLEFYHYVATFNIRKRKKTLQELDALKGTKSILIFKNDKEVSDFLTKTNFKEYSSF